MSRAKRSDQSVGNVWLREHDRQGPCLFPQGCHTVRCHRKTIFIIVSHDRDEIILPARRLRTKPINGLKTWVACQEYYERVWAGASCVKHFHVNSLFNERCEEIAHRLLDISGHLSRSCIERFRSLSGDRLPGERGDEIAHAVVDTDAYWLGSPPVFSKAPPPPAAPGLRQIADKD